MIDRLEIEKSKIIVSIDKTKYRNENTGVLKNWYPHQFNTMKLTDVTDDEGYINYVLDSESLEQFDISDYTILEKLRCAYNLLSFEKLANSGYYVNLEDENLYLDSDKSIVLMFAPKRDLYTNQEELNADFLSVIKARTISMFTKYSFKDILDSNFSVQLKTKFESEVQSAEDIAKLKELLIEYIDEKEKEQKEQFVYVNKRSYKSYRILTFVFLVSFILSLGSLVYTSSFEVRDLTYGNEILSLYISRDYSSVISTSKEIDLDKNQKYLVGYSAIMTSALNERKKEVVLTTFTPESSESLLDYWVAIGYGNYQDAISKGKTIGDDEYILYALRLEENRLVNNDTMDGTEKEQSLIEVRAEIATYEEKLGGEDNA